MSGGLSFLPGVRYGTGQAPESVAIGDLNGDGKPDLATGTGSETRLVCY